jgi:putative addiction module component (TIGR02574 family)
MHGFFSRLPLGTNEKEKGADPMAISQALMAELLHLSPEERIRLAEDLWDSIAVAPENLPSLTQTQIEEIDRRLAEHDRDPSTAIPWEEVKARIRSRLG